MTTLQKSADKNAFTEALVAFSLAIAAAILVKLPSLFGLDLDQNESFYIRNISLFVLPLLTGYFVWKRKIESHTLILLVSAFSLALLFANSYPFEQGGDTEALFALHLPIALWLIVGVAFSGGKWSEVSSRMDFIRFSGEMFIYYVLIALGGVVLVGFMALIFGTIGIDIEPVFESWVLSCVAGAVIIAAWLAEIRNELAGNFAPVLAKLFSPLFAIVIIAFLGTLLFTGNELIMDRDVLIAFDLLLVMVLCLLIYSISARDPEATPGGFDVIQVILVISALLADGVALWGISERIAEFGFTPNRVAALGMNLILLVNLTWSAVLYIRFLRGRSSFQALEKWQTDYLPVFVVWAAAVVIIFPLVFGFQ
ncbi:MAG TPA: hypothetical protein VFM80_07710 [Gracilimonas sp.]|uniref:hypothetical protein n=1 Tax=Gracilimonas sp. TaxID=1974203 RepID=UPI002D870E8F|nr:hypothetical protein [Gracilimonas sp.]